MKKLLLLLSATLACSTSTSFGATSGQQFLQYIYGAEGDVEKFCWPNDDLWMLRGAKNEGQIQAVAEAKVAPGSNDVFFEPINLDLCVVEMRNGKIDPAFNLQMVYTMHRQLILSFVYACLRQDKDALSRFTTHPQNVRTTGLGKVGGGDLDQYQDIISIIPVVRVSGPSADKISKSVTYRFPLQGKAVTIQLTKEGSMWKINTGLPLEIPLKFFFQ